MQHKRNHKHTKPLKAGMASENIPVSLPSDCLHKTLETTVLKTDILSYMSIADIAAIAII